MCDLVPLITLVNFWVLSNYIPYWKAHIRNASIILENSTRHQQLRWRNWSLLDLLQLSVIVMVQTLISDTILFSQTYFMQLHLSLYICVLIYIIYMYIHIFIYMQIFYPLTLSFRDRGPRCSTSLPWNYNLKHATLK